MKKNCWEFKKCGRESGGERVHYLGECPAALERRLNGIHEGKNAGRACWIVAGTFSEGERKRTCATELKDCVFCDFYKLVRREEFPEFQLVSTIVQELEKNVGAAKP